MAGGEPHAGKHRRRAVRRRLAVARRTRRPRHDGHGNRGDRQFLRGAGRAAGGRQTAARGGCGGRREEVAVIGYNLWRREFGGNPAAVGQSIRLAGRAATIVGVAPQGFAFPDGADVWQPLALAPDTLDEGWFSLVARLKSGATIGHAAEEAAILRRHLRATAPKQQPPDLLTVTVPFKDAIVGDVKPVLVLFVAAAVLLFLVGCLNVGNLLLVRGIAREREITLRAALGATRARLAGELMTESASLAVAGGILGVLVAFWLQRALVAAAPDGLPRLDQIGFDARALGFAAAGSILAAALAGIPPALWAARRSVFGRLRSDAMIEAGTMGAQVSRHVLICPATRLCAAGRSRFEQAALEEVFLSAKASGGHVSHRGPSPSRTPAILRARRSSYGMTTAGCLGASQFQPPSAQLLLKRPVGETIAGLAEIRTDCKHPSVDTGLDLAVEEGRIAELLAPRAPLAHAGRWPFAPGRSRATAASGPAIRSRMPCHRIDGSESSSHSVTLIRIL